jgi:site-specific DNA recombinase
MRYFIYCRKSTESEERQAFSIDSQYAEIQRAFGSLADVEIVGVYREAASAKAPGRPLFDEMIECIENGDAEGILAWHPDRLARNSVDGGKIIYLLDCKVVKALRFVTLTFENNPQGKFMLSITFGYSKHYVDALSENVKRGNRTKIERGWRPNQAPLGYLNDKETKTVVKDPIHFPLIRRMYELMLTGTYGPKEIALKARDEWGFITPKKKRIGGKPLALSSMYKILSNPFYAGIIVWAGQRFPGKHEPVVSIDEFERVQRLLGRPGRPQPKKQRFAFTGMMRCGDCGLMITAENKVNRHGYRYTYYHCTKRRLVPKCPQPCIEVRALEQQIVQLLDGIYVPPGIHRIVAKQLRESALQEEEQLRARTQSIERSIREAGEQLNELTGLRLRNLLPDEEFLARRGKLQQEQMRLGQERDRAQNDVNRFEPVEDVLFFRNRATEWFRRGDREAKRLILETVGSNLTLKNKILSIQARKAFKLRPLEDGLCTVLAIDDAVRRHDNVSEERAVTVIIRNVQQALAENMDEAALIQHNIRMLRLHMDGHRVSAGCVNSFPSSFSSGNGRLSRS